jgi:hypothetical protein
MTFSIIPHFRYINANIYLIYKYILSSRNKLIEDIKESWVFKHDFTNFDWLLDFIFVLFILYGLYLKFFYSISLPLNSDTISPGLVCREVFVHGNYLLQGYYFPAPDPHIFTEKIPFHLFPQLITGYNPKALSLSAYVIFVGVIITYSTIIYNLTKKIKNSFIFAALLANIPISANAFFLQPEIHVGAIFFIGILFLIYLNINGGFSTFFYLLVLALMCFSDSMIILWYFVPLFGTQTLLNRPFEMKKMSFQIFSGIIVSFVYILKKHIPTLVSYPINLITTNELLINHLHLFFKGICILYNNDLSNFSDTYQLNIYIILIVITTIGLLYILLDNISNAFTINPLWCLFVFISIILISLFYVFTMLSVDITTTRYFSFQLILFLSMLALIYSTNMKFQKAYIFLLILLIVINAGSNNELLQRGHDQPNQEQYKLINYLKELNLTYGYGDYWDSNIITYLSKDEVVIRPVIFVDAKMTPFRWLSCERWYKEQPITTKSLFVIQSNNQNKEIENFVHKNPPKNVLKFLQYKIYVWDSTKLRSVMDFN